MILKIPVFVMACVMFAVVLKQYKPEYSFAISIVCAIAVFFMMRDDLQTVIETLKQISERAGVDNKYITLLIKTMGIGCLTSFTASICSDTGERAMAEKILFAGKISILIIGSPVVFALLDTITGILP